MEDDGDDLDSSLGSNGGALFSDAEDIPPPPKQFA